MEQMEYERSGSPRRSRSRSRSASRSPRRSRSPKRDRNGGSNGTTDNPGNNLYISGLSSRVTEEELTDRFAKYGKVTHCEIVRDPHTRDSRGFGFVSMETGDEADAAIAGLNRTEFQGRSMGVEKARRTRARTPTPGRYMGSNPRDRERGGGRGDRGDRDRDYGRRDRDHGRDRDRDYGRDRYDDKRDRRERYDDRDRHERRDRYDDRDRRDRY